MKAFLEIKSAFLSFIGYNGWLKWFTNDNKMLSLPKKNMF